MLYGNVVRILTRKNHVLYRALRSLPDLQVPGSHSQDPQLVLHSAGDKGQGVSVILIPAISLCEYDNYIADNTGQAPPRSCNPCS